MKRTKIICTIGPASSTKQVVENMIKSGMDVARFNMSHGTFESHKELIDVVKDARNELNVPVALMIDTKGPEIRFGEFENGFAVLEKGKTFDLVTKKVLGNNERATISYAKLPEVLAAGTQILADDGKIELKVIGCENGVVHTKIVVGGKLSSRKSVNIPSANLDMPYVSAYDEKTIEFAVKVGADYVAISFVRTAADVDKIRKLLKKYGGEQIKIISKIESRIGTENVDEILRVSDGLMVARGDLGVEVDFAKIPMLQKQMLDSCTAAGKLSIVATQMLESMTTGSRPTRAEISDIANSVIDGTCAVMLSGETSVGAHPALATSTMAKIVEEAERGNEPNNVSYCNPESLTISDAMAYGAYSLLYASKADAIVCMYDIAADNVSDFSPNKHIFFFTQSQKEYNQSALLRGVVPILTKTKLSYASALDYLIEHKMLGRNALVVTLCKDTIKLEKL